MSKIRIYIPLAKCGDQRQYLAGQARDALKAQTVPCEIVECLAEGELQSQRTYSPARLTGEAAARNACIAAAAAAADEFFIMADRDRVAFATDTVERLLAAISADSTIGMVSAVDPRHCRFVDVGFVICRLSAFRQIVPIVNLYGECLCREINEALAKAGFKSAYLGTQNIQFTREV
jgi:hypothetical protein